MPAAPAAAWWRRRAHRPHAPMMLLARLLVLALLGGAAAAAAAPAFQDEVAPPRGGRRAPPPPAHARAAGAPAPADAVWALPAGDAELRAAVRAAYAAVQQRVVGSAAGDAPLPASELRAVALELGAAPAAAVSAAEAAVLDARLAQWAARQGLAAAAAAAEGAAEAPALPVALLAQAAGARFLRALFSSLQGVRAAERARTKRETLEEQARDAIAEL
jgi:hypothetical protein